MENTIRYTLQDDRSHLKQRYAHPIPCNALSPRSQAATPIANIAATSAISRTYANPHPTPQPRQPAPSPRSLIISAGQATKTNACTPAPQSAKPQHNCSQPRRIQPPAPSSLKYSYNITEGVLKDQNKQPKLNTQKHIHTQQRYPSKKTKIPDGSQHDTPPCTVLYRTGTVLYRSTQSIPNLYLTVPVPVPVRYRYRHRTARNANTIQQHATRTAPPHNERTVP